MRSSNYLGAAAVLLALMLPAAATGDVWTITPSDTLTVTSGGGPGEYSAVITPAGCDALNIPSGTYTGLRLSFDWQRLYGSVQPNQTAFSYYDPSLPALPWNRIGSYVRSSPLVTVPGTDPVRLTFDEPTFWMRSFYTVPTAYPGGEPLGARFNLWYGNSSVRWSNIEIELYEATISQVAGDSYSSGTWNRPLVDTWLGHDFGRAALASEYGVQEFTVDESGIYGIHTHFYGADYCYAGTYLFQDEFDVAGAYDHLLAANEQGDYGVGYPDIKSVYLEAGRTYFLVQANNDPGFEYTFNSWIGGPGHVNIVPEPTSLALLALAAALASRGRRGWYAWRHN